MRGAAWPSKARFADGKEIGKMGKQGERGAQRRAGRVCPFVPKRLFWAGPCPISPNDLTELSVVSKAA